MLRSDPELTPPGDVDRTSTGGLGFLRGLGARSAPVPAVRRALLGVAGLCGAVATAAVYDCGSAACASVTAVATACALALSAYAATGRAPRPLHVVQHLAVAVLLALAADARLHVWQAPTAWSDLLRLSGPGAGLALLGYLATTLALQLTRGRSPSPFAAACFLGAPLLFNGLLVLQSPALLEALGRRLGSDALGAATLQALGIFVVLAIFNEVVAAGLARLESGSWGDARDWRLHLLLLAAAAWAALTPTIASWGTSVALATWPVVPRVSAAVAATVLAEAGLWAQTFLVTGMLLDALRGRPPASSWAERHFREGLGKGAVYSGAFVGVMLGIGAFLARPGTVPWLVAHPWAGAAVVGAVSFPLAKAIAESFDGSSPFLRRLKGSYASAPLYLRGAVAGLGIGWALTVGLPAAGSLARFLAGFVLGAAVYAGADLAIDALEIARGRRRRLQSWRPYALGALLGGFVGGGLAWYLDTAQLSVVVDKFRRYAAVHFPAAGLPVDDYVVYPLFSKWGAMDLGRTVGAARLLFNESLSGVVNWSLAAPLFSINLVLLTALVHRSTSPVRQLFTREGGVAMAEQAVRVLRWGLWMAPIIYSLLRIAPEPSWYNQDGAVRTLVATAKSLTLDPAHFRAWSLDLFLAMLVNDWLRVLIWFDHMGLRVATLVNLSFIGGDPLDEAAARFVGYTARRRVIPEGIRRFATWAPLLIPFYLPRGADWDYAWGRMETLRAAHPAADLWPLFLPVVTLAVGATLLAGLSRRRRADAPTSTFTLSNGVYALELRADGQGYSRVLSTLREGEELDLTRRPADPLHPCGKFFFLVDRDAAPDDPGRAWSLGDEPLGARDPDRHLSQVDRDTLLQSRTWRGVRAEAKVALVGGERGERWRLRLTNLEERPRRLLLTSYREFVLAGQDAFERHPSYQRLHLGTCFLRSHAALVVGNRSRPGPGRPGTRETAFHAVRPAEGSMRLVGYEDARPAFVGTDGLRAPAGLERPLRPPEDEGLLYTFDPAAALQLEVELPALGSAEAVFVDGYAEDERRAARCIERWLELPRATDEALEATLGRRRELPAAPAEAYRFEVDGRGAVRVGWSTPRPWCHLLANEAGYGVLVRNDGALYSFMGNSQQYGLTPFPGDASAIEVPGQALYLRDLDTGAVLSPTHLPTRDRAPHDVEFGLGHATFRKVVADGAGEVELELTLCVPPGRTAEVRLLRVRNRGQRTLRYRLVSYAEMILGEVPRDGFGRLEVRYDENRQALLFANRGNDFHDGWAFVAPGFEVEGVETVRSRFVGGPGRTLADPVFLSRGSGDPALPDDGHRVAAFGGTLIVPPGQEASATLVLGWAEAEEGAAEIIQDLGDPASALAAIERTRAWWEQELSALRIETDEPGFDRLVNDWLPYQVRVSRLWGRLGPSQRGGAFGFRDQLQDVLPLTFTHPHAARKQILLHAAQQFREGDVLQWWHPRRDGTTGLAARNHASDPHLWLVHVACRYLQATGDLSLLDERLPFLEGERIPPGAEGLVFVPRASRDVVDVYEHLRRAVDRTCERLGPHGLPLIGTGDWNDGFSQVGVKGRGESVWLGFFLHRVLVDFAPFAERKEGPAARDRDLARAEALKAALAAMWRDDRFVRAVTDDGEEMRNSSALVSSWPALSGAVDPARAAQAVAGGLKGLEAADYVRVLHPPFSERSRPNPGRISHYPPGVRENGGQYSHGASWLIDACTTLAESATTPEAAAAFRADAWRLWRKISPLAHVTPEAIGRYGLAPHQQPADIYAGEGHDGRGGWSWYTGAAARMLSAAYGLVGLKVEGGAPRLSPAARAASGGPRLRGLRFRGKDLLAPADAPPGAPPPPRGDGSR